MPNPQSPAALNERVLREVLGYGLLIGKAVPAKYRHLHVGIDEQQVWWKSETDHYCVLCGQVPDYLTWEGMGVVLEEMRGRGYKIVTYSQNAEGRSPHYCRVSRADDEDDFMIAGERGTTLPEAAALAALAALESEG